MIVHASDVPVSCLDVRRKSDRAMEYHLKTFFCDAWVCRLPPTTHHHPLRHVLYSEVNVIELLANVGVIIFSTRSSLSEC